jgi:hypothetical protein
VQALSHATSPVPRALLVMDGLDECDKIGAWEGGLLVPLLVGCLRQLPFSLKVFITSRDEPSIRRMFESLPVQDLHKTALHVDIEENIVNADIELYLYEKLRSISPSEPAWPPAAAVTKIAHHANGLFVYAVTIVKYIRSNSVVVPPSVLLDEVLSTSHTDGQSHYQDLDSLYLKVFRQSVYESRRRKFRTLACRHSRRSSFCGTCPRALILQCAV